MNIFLTGSSGFIGKHLFNNLLKNNNLMIFLFFKKNKKNLLFKKKFSNDQRVKIFFGYPNDKNQLKKIILSSDIICNLGFPNKNKFKKKISKKEYLLTLKNILNILKEKKSYKLVHISSSEVYGFKKINNNKKFSENSRKLPMNVYAKAKIDAEKLIINSGASVIRNTIILRLFNVYGDGQSPNNLISEIDSKLKKNKKKINLKNIYNKRDYIFIDDVINAIKIALFSRNIHGVFNVSSGKSLSVKEIFEIIKGIRKSKANLVDSKNIKISNFSGGNNTKILKKLRWKPKYTSINSFGKNIRKVLLKK